MEERALRISWVSVSAWARVERPRMHGFGSDSSRPGDVAVMSQREVYFFSEDDGGPLYGEDVLWESDSRTVGCFNKSPGGFSTVWVFRINAESTQYLM